MNDERTSRVRKVCDGEELVDYDPQLPALLATPANPSLANVERRHRALSERVQEPGRPWRNPPVQAAPR